jgi:fatty-acyl-CoA synthase
MDTTKVLGDLLLRNTRERPDAPAISFDRRTVSHGKLARRTERASARLWHEWGVRPGDRVAWLGFNHVDQLTLLFALGRLGAVLVPLNVRLAPAEWDAVVASCTPRAVVHDDAWHDAAMALAARNGLDARAVDALIATHADSDAPDLATPDTPALLVYTSGTTGLPRGAVHTHANLLANMVAACAVQSITPLDTVLTVLPLFHVGGLCIQTLPALYAGAHVRLHPRFDPAATLAAIAQERPTLTLQVPATMQALVEHPLWGATDLGSLRAVWAGSSTLPKALVSAFLGRGVALCNVYGATETGPFSVALPPEHARSHLGSCGWPATGVEARLQNVKAGVGEVLLRGPAIVQRYWTDVPALDADGWFHTGDLASCATDGSFTIVGRAKDMIISGGENIYPAEIEHLLATHPAVAECAVVGVPDDTWGEAVVAAVVLKPGCALEDAGVTDFLTGKVARFKLPRRVVRFEALPKTALGKVQKMQLTDQILQNK